MCDIFFLQKPFLAHLLSKSWHSSVKCQYFQKDSNPSDVRELRRLSALDLLKTEFARIKMFEVCLPLSTSGVTFFQHRDHSCQCTKT